MVRPRAGGGVEGAVFSDMAKTLSGEKDMPESSLKWVGLRAVGGVGVGVGSAWRCGTRKFQPAAPSPTSPQIFYISGMFHRNLFFF